MVGLMRYTAVSEDDQAPGEGYSARPRSHSAIKICLGVLLAASLITNVAILLQHKIHPMDATLHPNYANLAWNVPSVVRPTSPFNDPDLAVQDAAWRSDIVKPMQFVVALDDAYAKGLGLLHSMRWPWDKTKGVYVVHSGHKLHCLHLLRQAAMDQRDGVEPRWGYSHQIHCIEMFLQDEMCHPDDTLMYTGFLHDSANATGSVVGIGTKRMCRDWNKLRAWANEHSACYDPSYGEDDPHVNERDRYKFCPDG